MSIFTKIVSSYLGTQYYFLILIFNTWMTWHRRRHNAWRWWKLPQSLPLLNVDDFLRCLITQTNYQPSFPLIDLLDLSITRVFTERHWWMADWLSNTWRPTPLTKYLAQFHNSSTVRSRGCRWHLFSPRHLAAVKRYHLFWLDVQGWRILVASSHSCKCPDASTIGQCT